MDENKLNESSFRRARHDFVGVRHKIWYFGAVELVMSSAGLFIGSLIVPDQASNFVTAGYPVAGAIIGALIGMTIIFIICLFRAPYNQRNEARTAIGLIKGELSEAEKRSRELEKEPANSARKRALKDRFNAHLEEVREFIEHLRDYLVIPLIHQVTPGTHAITDELNAIHNFSLYKEHLPCPELWDSYSELEVKLPQYLNVCRDLRKQLRELWKVEGTEPTRQFEEPILKLMAGDKKKLQYGISIVNGRKEEELQYQILYADNQEVVRGLEASKPGQSFGPYLLYDEQCNKWTLPDEYEKLNVKFTYNNDTTTRAKDLFKELIRLQVNICDSLQESLVRGGYINYDCKLCPKPIL